MLNFKNEKSGALLEQNNQPLVILLILEKHNLTSQHYNSHVMLIIFFNSQDTNNYNFTFGGARLSKSVLSCVMSESGPFTFGPVISTRIK